MTGIIFHDIECSVGCTAELIFNLMGQTRDSAIAEFIDGSKAYAIIEQLNDQEIKICIGEYSTLKGLVVPKGSWRLNYECKHKLWKVISEV